MTIASCMPSYAKSAATVKDFLEWDKQSQDSYFQISIAMSVFIAAQIDKGLGQCLLDWYPSDINIVAKRNDEIRKRMSHALEYHPNAALLAILQKECGRFSK